MNRLPARVNFRCGARLRGFGIVFTTPSGGRYTFHLAYVDPYCHERVHLVGRDARATVDHTGSDTVKMTTLPIGTNQDRIYVGTPAPAVVGERIHHLGGHAHPLLVAERLPLPALSPLCSILPSGTAVLNVYGEVGHTAQRVVGADGSLSLWGVFDNHRESCAWSVRACPRRALVMTMVNGALHECDWTPRLPEEQGTTFNNDDDDDDDNCN